MPPPECNQGKETGKEALSGAWLPQVSGSPVGAPTEWPSQSQEGLYYKYLNQHKEVLVPEPSSSIPAAEPQSTSSARLLKIETGK